jgi:DNA-directed RNA polymerase subunit M/transcription elongation factor TFIIS
MICEECGNEMTTDDEGYELVLWHCWKCGNESLINEEKLTLGEQNTITEFEKQNPLTEFNDVLPF